MSELEEQKFIAQKCGENCTCHNLIKQEKLKTIDKSEMSAYLIRGVVDGAQNKEIANKNANVHNFLAHMKYRILDGHVENKDTELLIFQDPPEDLIIHPNGLIKHDDVIAVSNPKVKELWDLKITAPQDIKTFAEKLIQIDCNTDGLDKLINDKLKDIKGVIREHNKSSPGKQLTLDDLSKVKTVEIETQTTETKEDEYRKEIKDIIKEELSIDAKDEIKNLTEDQVKSLASSEEIKTKFSTLNNKYNNIYLAKTDDSLYKTVDSFVKNTNPDQNESLLDKILKLLGINANKNVAVQAGVVGARTDKADADAEKQKALAEKQKQKEQKEKEAKKKLKKEQKELAAAKKLEERLKRLERLERLERLAKEKEEDILIIAQGDGSDNREHKINFSQHTRSPMRYASIPTKQSDTNNLPCALPPGKVKTLKDLNGLVGISYVNKECLDISLALNYNRYLNIKEYAQKDLDINILDINMETNDKGKNIVTNKQFSQIFSRMSLYSAINKAHEILGVKDNKLITEINNADKSDVIATLIKNGSNSVDIGTAKQNITNIKGSLKKDIEKLITQLNIAPTTKKAYCSFVVTCQQIKEYNLLNRFDLFKEKKDVLSNTTLTIDRKKSQPKNFELLKIISTTNNMSGNNTRNISNTNRLDAQKNTAKFSVTRQR